MCQGNFNLPRFSHCLLNDTPLLSSDSLTALDRWTYPPFSGTVDDEWIYGRGAGDCKNNVIGILSAVEHLLESQWKPARNISERYLYCIMLLCNNISQTVLAFGQDEEISGPRGATNIGKYLQQVYGKNGIAMIVDEGGMNLDNIYGKEFALPGIAEKGYLVRSIIYQVLSS